MMDEYEIDKPKEVLMFENMDGEDDFGRPVERISYGCPNCGKGYLVPYELRCPRCEQMLKW